MLRIELLRHSSHRHQDSCTLIHLRGITSEDLDYLASIPGSLLKEISPEDSSFSRAQKVGYGVPLYDIRRVFALPSPALLNTVLLGRSRRNPHLAQLRLQLENLMGSGDFWIREVEDENSDLAIPWGEIEIGGDLLAELAPENPEESLEEFFHPHENHGEVLIHLTKEV